MAKVELVKEILDAHSDEEMVSFISSRLKDILRDYMSTESSGERFQQNIGQIIEHLSLTYKFAKALDERMNRNNESNGPIVVA